MRADINRQVWGYRKTRECFDCGSEYPKRAAWLRGCGKALRSILQCRCLVHTSKENCASNLGPVGREGLGLDPAGFSSFDMVEKGAGLFVTGARTLPPY